MKIENKANKVVTEVIKVLDNVSLTDKFETWSISSLLNLDRFSDSEKNDDSKNYFNEGKWTKKNDLKEETKEKSNESVEIEKNVNQTTSLKKENLPTGLKHIKDHEEDEKENKESWI